MNALSGLFMVVLGLFVLRLSRAAKANRAFAWFAVFFGLVWLVSNLSYEAGHKREVGAIVSGACALGAASALAWLASVYPVSIEARGRTGPIGVGVVGGLQALGWGTMLFLAFGGVPLSFGVLAAFVYNAGLMTLFMTGWAVLVLLAAGRRDTASDPTARRAVLLLSIALLPYFSFALGQVPILWLDGSLDRMPWVGLTLTGGTILTYTSAWTASRWRSPERGAEAWLPLVAGFCMVAGFVLTLSQPNNPGFGATRIFMVVVVAYSIVKHQLLGIDVKVRWALSKTTLAAIFVAVFFIASEAAQEFFGERFGSQYVGILAAGVLVFAIAPLSHLAERLAEKVVPPARASARGQPTDRPGASPEAIYRAALRAATGDGVLTRREEVHLAEIAEGLGIGPRRALEIRSEVENEIG